MKKSRKLITMLLAFAFIASFAYVKPAAAAEQEGTKEVVTTPGTITTDYFSMTIPEEYKGKFVAEVDGSSITVYSKKCYEWSEGKYGEGIHTGVVYYAYTAFTDDYKYFGEYKAYKTVGSMKFVVQWPTDVQVPGEGEAVDYTEKAKITAAQAEYEELNGLGMGIVGETIKPLVTAPGPVTLKSAKNVKGKKVKVTYEGKTDDILYYDVQIGEKYGDDWSWYSKTTSKSAFTFSKVFESKFKKGKTYKVRVRGIGKKGDTWTYGKWSKTKTIKIKK